MKTVSIVLAADGSTLQINQDKLYVHVHECAQLEIELAGELISEDIDYHVISFEPKGTNNKISTQNIYIWDGTGTAPNAYNDGDKLYCKMPFELCSNKSLDIQVEAHRQSNNLPTFIAKSAVFSVTFENSLTGCAREISLDAFDLLPKLHSMLDELKEVIQSPIVQGISTTSQEINLEIPLTVPTLNITDNSNKAATTEFVQQLLAEIFETFTAALNDIIGGG